MNSKLLLTLALVTLAGSFAPAAARAAAAPNLATEYEQVRKIALRDEKVRKAFDKANAQLEEKMIDLDPALEAYIKSRNSAARAEAGRSQSKPSAQPKPVLKPLRETPRISNSRQKTHALAKGETLSSVAAHYHVSVSELRRANHLQDDHKLVIGQVLIIPTGK